MREHPDLNQLKRQAKELLRTFDASSNLGLHDAQLMLARSYGFASWPKLKAYVDGVTIRRLADAVRANDLAKAKSMLKARPELANVTMSYGDERRAIHFAVMQRSPELVRLLMRNGADARAGIHPHRAATTAWILAKERGFEEIVAIIEEEEGRRREPAAESESEPEPAALPDEPARSRVAAGDIEWLKREHSAGRLQNSIRWDDGGLLTVAVRHDQPEALALLLDFGFDPNERVSEGEGDWIAYSQGFPLWHAAALGKRQMAEILLARGADPNVHVDSSGSSVYSAYSHKQWEMAELLRRHGGIVTADIAAIYRQTDVARQLLANDPTCAEEMLRFAGDGGATEIVRMALGHIDWPPDDARWFGYLASSLSFWHHIPWLYAGNREFDRDSYLACFQLVLSRCDANVIGGFGRTVLHEVAAMGSWVAEEEAEPFARALLEAGAKTNLRDDILKSTPLGWASRWGRDRVVEALLEHGADPVEADAEPWATPRAWAEKKNHTAILKRLYLTR
jgi:ankyrin repeat protein